MEERIRELKSRIEALKQQIGYYDKKEETPQKPSSAELLKQKLLTKSK